VENGKRRAQFRAQIEQLLRDKGIKDVPSSDPVYRSAAILQQRAVERVAVWSYQCTYEALLPFDEYNPYTERKVGSFIATLDERLDFSRAIQRSKEHEELLKILRQTMGHWYKGINSDVRSVVKAISAARTAEVSGRREMMTHVLLTNRVLMVGKVTFSRLARPICNNE
jgi:hypothetical protein